MNKPQTIADLLEFYEAHICEYAQIKPETAHKNANELRQIAALAGVTALKNLNFKTLLTFRKAKYEQANLKYATSPRLNYRLNSTTAQARSVFSARALKLYASHKIEIPPEIDSFLTAPILRPTLDPHFIAIPTTADAKIKADCTAVLNGADIPNLTPLSAVMIELARYCGLTNSEIHAFNLAWINTDAAGTYIDITSYEQTGSQNAFATKRGAKNRQIAISQERLQNWMRVLSPLKPPYFGQYSDHKNTNSIYRQTCAYLAQYLTTQKKLHELRKMACSEVLARDKNIFTAAKFIGDSLKTTAKFYAAPLQRINAL